MTQRREHQGRAIAELQDERRVLADAPTLSGDTIPVSGLEEGDTLLAVYATADGGLTAPTEHAANCTIVQPRAYADVDPDADPYEEDDWVKVGVVKFLFKDEPTVLVDNYPVGSNRSERVVEVDVGANAAGSAANLAAAINAAFARDRNGATASVVDTDHVRVQAKLPGSVGENLTISKSTGVNAFAGANGGTDNLEVLTGAEIGFTCSDDLTGAQATGGIEVVFRKARNEEAQDVASLLAGTYKPGDADYDANGLGRLPPGT